jgi:hypothetical protein
MHVTQVARPNVDVRTRTVGAAGDVGPATFWSTDWADALAQNGATAAADAARLGLEPITLVVEGDPWTLRAGRDTIEVAPGTDGTTPHVALDRGAFADFVCEQRTALGLAIGGRVDGDGTAIDRFCQWDPVLRSAIDGRALYQPGDVELCAIDGGQLDLGERHELGEHTEHAAHFLAEAGFLLLTGVFTDGEIDAFDRDLGRAVLDATPDDGESWWATTRDGARYPTRILSFERKSPALRALLDDPRIDAIGDILGDGHRPGDPFGEHYADVTAEGLVKRVDSVDGLVCLPWHKDCDRGGHSMFCCGLTIGVCLTPVDEAHGGLDVIAGSHRANIARAQLDRGLDLPEVTLRAERGDVTIHLSCTLHRSTHPTTHERRVAYTGFTLPARAGDRYDSGARGHLEEQRAAIGDPGTAARLTGWA